MSKGPSVPGWTILLVEDEIELATEIKVELERHGYLVRPVSMADAADIARTNGAAMLILDRLLYGVDRLRALGPVDTYRIHMTMAARVTTA